MDKIETATDQGAAPTDWQKISGVIASIFNMSCVPRHEGSNPYGTQ
jgi:hypothetical protein